MVRWRWHLSLHVYTFIALFYSYKLLCFTVQTTITEIYSSPSYMWSASISSHYSMCYNYGVACTFVKMQKQPAWSHVLCVIHQVIKSLSVVFQSSHRVASCIAMKASSCLLMAARFLSHCCSSCWRDITADSIFTSACTQIQTWLDVFCIWTSVVLINQKWLYWFPGIICFMLRR